VIKRDRVIKVARPFVAKTLANLKPECLPLIYADKRGSNRISMVCWKWQFDECQVFGLIDPR